MDIKANFGTKDRREFVICADDYDINHATSATPEEMQTAFNMLEGLFNDERFADDGHRNDQAVNACIALWILGYDDPIVWFDNMFHDPDINDSFYQCDIDRFMEHVERITPYLYSWGPVGIEGNALKYAL